jgi:hypothetical protein
LIVPSTISIIQSSKWVSESPESRVATTESPILASTLVALRR